MIKKGDVIAYKNGSGGFQLCIDADEGLCYLVDLKVYKNNESFPECLDKEVVAYTDIFENKSGTNA